MDDTIACADKTNSNHQFSHSRYLFAFLLFNRNQQPNKRKRIYKSHKYLVINVFFLSLGSHDSMSYGINRRAKVAPDAEPVVRRLYKVLPCVVRRWAITQNLNALEQLNNGIR